MGLEMIHWRRYRNTCKMAFSSAVISSSSSFLIKLPRIPPVKGGGTIRPPLLLNLGVGSAELPSSWLCLPLFLRFMPLEVGLSAIPPAILRSSECLVFA